MCPAPSRETLLAKLGDAELDVLVVGSGITGACIALESAQRGLRTALIDRGDFGGGTTANCLRIIHGGLRYLQHLDLARSRLSSSERSRWLRFTPHLVDPLPVVIPTLRGTFPPRWILAGALAVNELISADRNSGLEAGRRIPRARVLSRSECRSLVPVLDHADVTGGILFHDAVMYSPERITLEMVLAAQALGAVVANHVECEGSRLVNGRVVACRVRDVLTGAASDVRTRWVINAAGAQVGDVARRLAGERSAAQPAYSIALSLLTSEPATGPAFTAYGGPPDPDRVVASGSRQLFVLPWRGQRLYGTAHFPFSGDPARPELPEELVERFLQELAGAKPRLPVARERIRVIQWGLLPVAGRAEADRVRLLKQHRIVDHSTEGVAGALSVVSVKFTTARHVAASVVDRLAGNRPAHARLARPPLPGNLASDVETTIASAKARLTGELPDDVLEHLVRSYGARYERVVALARSIAGGADRVSPDAPVIFAQLVFGVREEQACTTDDLLWRRCELGPRGLITEESRRQAERALRLAHDAA